MSEASGRVIKTVLVPGPAPHIHAQQLKRLRDEWPALVGALRLLIAEERGLDAIPKEWR